MTSIRTGVTRPIVNKAIGAPHTGIAVSIRATPRGHAERAETRLVLPANENLVHDARSGEAVRVGSTKVREVATQPGAASATATRRPTALLMA